MDLRKVPTEALAAELRKRPDLLEDGVMPFHVHKLVEQIQPIVCVDGIPLRRSDKRFEAMAIRRGTGASKGLLVPVGGKIRFLESIEQALQRHFQSDIGCEIEILPHWTLPTSAGQWAPMKDGEVPPDFHPEGAKHAVQLLYPVRLLGEPANFGTTAHGGQEAVAVEWFGFDDMPPPGAFGAEHRQSFVNCLEAAQFLAWPI